MAVVAAAASAAAASAVALVAVTAEEVFGEDTAAEASAATGEATAGCRPLPERPRSARTVDMVGRALATELVVRRPECMGATSITALDRVRTRLGAVGL